MTMTMRSLLSVVALAAYLPANPMARALSTARRRARAYSALSSSPGPLELESVEEALRTRAKEEGLSPFLRGMVDEQRALQLHVGRAMDVLRRDHPQILRRAPDYSIYHDDVTLTAADGRAVRTLSAYKQMCGVVRTMLSLLYDADASVVQSRMVYDPARTQIRVSVNARLEPKLGGRAVHVDGISVYSVDLTPEARGGEGKITEHRIEKLLVNGAALQPPYLNAFGLAMTSEQRTGALAGVGAWG